MENNPCIQELKAFASLPMAPGQKAFFERRLSDAREVRCCAMEDVFNPAQIRFLRKVYHPRKKECYKNASDLVELGPFNGFGKIGEFKYVEGLCCPSGLIPIEHAFVKVGDLYIDPTFEMALKEDVSRNYYVSLIEIDWEDLAQIQAETGFYGEIYRYRYGMELEAKRRAKEGR